MLPEGIHITNMNMYGQWWSLLSDKRIGDYNFEIALWDTQKFKTFSKSIVFLNKHSKLQS
jgi:hypothetical protein